MRITPQVCQELMRSAGGAGTCGIAIEDIRPENSGLEPDLVFAYSKTRSGSDPEFDPDFLARHFLDALDHLVDRLLRRPLVGDHAVHRLRPHVLVVEDGEFPVL